MTEQKQAFEKRELRALFRELLKPFAAMIPEIGNQEAQTTRLRTEAQKPRCPEPYCLPLIQERHVTIFSSRQEKEHTFRTIL